ncbi:hypothetical protein ES703_09099 [subsurface metagenome]
MERNILSTPKGNTIKLGKKEYKLSPLNLNVLASIEEEFDCTFAELGEKLEKRQASSLLKLIYILLKDNYPDMTQDKIGGLVDLDNLEEVSTILSKALGGE